MPLSRVLLAALAFCICALSLLSSVHAGNVHWDAIISGSLIDTVVLSSDTAGPSYTMSAPSGAAAPIDATSVRYLMLQSQPFGVPIREDRPYNAKQSWLGPDGELWMYSASGRTLRYNRESTQWSEVLPTGYYDFDADGVIPVWGTRKDGNSTVTPGSRQGACIAVDDAGNAWLSGGGVVIGSGASADVFKLDSSTLIWSWMGGVDNSGSNYFRDPNFSGGLGNALPGSDVGPGAMSMHGCTWADGKLWIIGGRDSSFRNDLWSFDPVADQWRWESGLNYKLYDPSDMAADCPWGAQGVENTTVPSLPLPRTDSPMLITDRDGYIWMYGGAVANARYWGLSGDDLWRFSTISKRWTWMQGGLMLRGNLSPAMPVDYPAASSAWPAPHVPGAKTMPGRHRFTAHYSSNAHVLYFVHGLFNTQSGTDTSYGRYDDVWSLDLASLQWTYLTGCTGLDSGAPVFGQPIPQCWPTSQLSGWLDRSGSLWFAFGEGGVGQDPWNEMVWQLQAPVNSVQIVVAPREPTSNVTSIGVPGQIGTGVNLVTLGQGIGVEHVYRFKIYAADGTASAPFTLRITEAACPATGPCTDYTPADGGHTDPGASTGGSGSSGEGGQGSTGGRCVETAGRICGAETRASGGALAALLVAAAALWMARQ